MSCIKEKFEEFAYESSMAGVKAFLAENLSLGDGVLTPDEILLNASANDLAEAEMVCGDILSELQDEYDFMDIMEELSEFMDEHAHDEEEEPQTVSAKTTTPVTVAAALAPAPASAPASVTTSAAANPASAANAGSAPVQANVTAPAATTAPATRTSANYASFINDNFEAGFNVWADFVQCVDDMEKTEQVFTHDEDMQTAGIGFDPVQNNLNIVAVEDNPIGAAAIAKSMNANVDAVASTMVSQKGTGLAMEMDNGRIVPIGWSAMSGMEKRAGYDKDGLTRHWKKSPEVAAQELNGQFRNGSGGVTVLERCHKIRGMMSSRFAYAKFSNILNAFHAFWKKQYPNGTVQNMYISHTEIYWELNLEPYKQQIFTGFPDLLTGNSFPILQFASSNTANSAFRITPAMGMTGSKNVVPLCARENALAVRHSAEGNFATRCDTVMNDIINKFAESIPMLDSTSRDLQAMHGITVKNAYNAILRVMASVGIPKKQGMEAAENFKNVYGMSPASAFDCFMCVVNAYSFFVRDNKGKANKHFEIAMAVGKAAGAKWELQGNIPGDFTW